MNLPYIDIPLTPRPKLPLLLVIAVASLPRPLACSVCTHLARVGARVGVKARARARARVRIRVGAGARASVRGTRVVSLPTVMERCVSPPEMSAWKSLQRWVVG